MVKSHLCFQNLSWATTIWFLCEGDKRFCTMGLQRLSKCKKKFIWSLTRISERLKLVVFAHKIPADPIEQPGGPPYTGQRDSVHFFVIIPALVASKVIFELLQTWSLFENPWRNWKLILKSESKKRAHVQKLAISKKSTFFVQSSWNLVKMITSCGNYFHQVS